MAEATVQIKIADLPEVKAALADAQERLEAANALASGVRSFLESLPFCAPENVGVQAQAKLVGPLSEYNAACFPVRGSAA